MKRLNLRIPSNMYLLYPFIIILSINLMLIDVSAETYSCMPCLVRACHEILGEHFYVNLPSPSYGDIDSSSYQTVSSCSQLNMAIDDWIRGDEPNTCPGIGLAELACEQLVVLNQTQIGCNSMSMALDPSFRRRCESLIQCNIPSPERITRSNACQAAHAFVDALHFDMGPISSCGCKSCRLHACDGWSTPVIQSTNQPLVNRLELGKVELYLSASDLSSGITCEALQHAVHTLSTSPVDSNNPHDHVIAMNATCFPLAKASNLDWGSRRCGLSAQLYDELDPVVFNELSMSRGALSWPHICPKYLKSVYSHDIAEQLMASGYCNSPTTGLLKFVANSMNHTISSTGPAGSGEGNHAGQINPTLFVTIMFVLTLIAVL